MKPSILLVDRENILVGPLQREFGAHRPLRIATSIEQARQLMRESASDIVIIDADMPQAMGFVTELRAIDDPIVPVGLTDSIETQTYLHAIGLENIVFKREGPQPVLDAVRQYGDPDLPIVPSDRTEVLIVDDEKDLLPLFSKVLDMWGYKPLTAADGEKALQMIDEHPGIGAVLLDLRLTGKAGMEVLHEIQKKNPRIGVIMLSSLADRETAQRALKLGAFDYVTKPPDFPRLQSTLIACLGHEEYQSQSWGKRLLG